MNIKIIKFEPATVDGKVKAFLDVEFIDLGLIVRGIKQVEGKTSKFYSFPSKKMDEKWVDIVEFTNMKDKLDFKNSIETEIDKMNESF